MASFAKWLSVRVQTKWLWVRIPLLSLNVRIIIYLDNMLLMASSLEDLLMARDTLIFIPQHLGFMTNIKEPYLEPTSTLTFLRVIIDSGEMNLSLPKRMSSKYRIYVMRNGESKGKGAKQTNREVINSSSSRTPLLFASSKSTDNFVGGKERTVMVGKKLTLYNERSLISPYSNNKIRCIITWLGSSQGQTTGRPWSEEEQKSRINVLDLKTAKLAIMSFALKERDEISVHLYMDNMMALSDLMKIGGTKNQELTAISK